MASQRRFFDGGQSPRSAAWASSVCATKRPRARAASSTRAAAGTADRSGATSLPSDAPKPSGSRKSRCQSIMSTPSARADGHANAKGFAAAIAPPPGPGGATARTRGAGGGHVGAPPRGAARGRASSAATMASAAATAPKTPCCIVTILSAAAWFPASVAPVPSATMQHS